MRKLLCILVAAFVLVASMGATGGNTAKLPVQKQTVINQIFFSLILKADGTVWEDDSEYSSDNGDTVSAVKVKNLSKIVSLAASTFHCLALRSDGTVWEWDSMTTKKADPVQVKGLANVVYIAEGTSHSLAIKSDGTVWGWGNNSMCQLGVIGKENIPKPIQLKQFGSVVAVDGNYYCTVAVKKDGTVWKLGGIEKVSPGTKEIKAQKVEKLKDVVSVSAAFSSFSALTKNGTVWVADNQFMDSKGQFQNIYQVNIRGVKQIAAGGDDYSAYTAALKSDGTVWIWGVSGTPSTFTQIDSPEEIKSLSGSVSISSGADMNVMALKKDGTVWLRKYNDATKKETTIQLTDKNGNQMVIFCDKGFERLVRIALNKKTGSFLSTELASIKSFKMNGLSPYPLAMVQSVNGVVSEYKDSKGNTYTEAGSVNSLKDLKYFKSLNTLVLNIENITDIGPVAGLTNLRSLSLEDNRITDLSPVCMLKNLTMLELSGNSFNDISCLKNLTNLKILNIQRNKIKDLSPLSNLSKLNGLYLSGSTFPDLNPIKSLKGLTSLALSSTNISDIGPLKYLTNLETLELSYDNNLKDISLLKGMKKLKYLNVQGDKLTDASVLNELAKAGVKIDK